MGFLAPALLAGMAALALPWWLHRLHSKSSQRRQFPSAMLLEEAERQVHVQRQLKYRWLMALRMLLLVVLFLAFAQPFLSQSNTTSDTSLPALLIDDSYSMRSVDIEAAANALLDSGPAPDNWTLLIPGQAAQVVDRPTLNQRLAEFSPGFQRRDYGELIAELDELKLPSRLHLLSDLQNSALPARFADMVSGTQLILPPYPELRTNVFVSKVTVTTGRVDVDVSGQPDDDELPVQVSLRIEDELLPARALNAGRASFELPPLLDQQYRLQIDVSSNDSSLEDNRFFTVIDRRPPSPVPLLVPTSNSPARTYLGAALNGDTSRFEANAYVAGRIDSRTLQRSPWIIVVDPGALDPTLRTGVQDYLQSGGRVVAFSGPATLSAETLPFLDNPRLASVQTSRTGMRARALDSAHPAVDAAGDWSSVAVYRHNRWQATDTDRVLVELTNGDPWIIERNVGNGRVLFVGSALEPSWTDLASRGVFVGFMQELGNYLSGSNSDRQHYTVGDFLQSRDVEQLINPIGERRINRTGEQNRALMLDLPGFYTVYSSDSERIIAANIDRRESLPAPMSAELLTRWQASAGKADENLASSDDDTEAKRTPLWPILLVLMLLIAITETLVANRTQHLALGA